MSRRPPPLYSARSGGFALLSQITASPLWDVPQVRWASLQVGPRTADLRLAPKNLIADLAPDLHEFADTAAALLQLDLVITPDTTVAHLAGVRELPSVGGYRVLYEVVPDIGRNDTAGDVRALRVFGPGQDRNQL